VSSTNGGTGNTAMATLTMQPADLAIAKTHAAPFFRGQVGATYGITVSNNGAGPTTGTVTVVDTLPNVANTLVPTALSGTGWTCTLGTLTCTRSDALAPGGSYPSITLTVDVPANIAESFTNTATVSGGGETNTGNDTASDPTTIENPPLIAKAFKPPVMAINATSALTFTVTNPGTNTVALTGVTFTDVLSGMLIASPNGLTGDCGGGAITAVSGTTTIALSGAMLPVNGTCTFSVDVTPTGIGTLTNTTGNVTSTNGGAGGTASARLTVVTAAVIPTLSQGGLLAVSMLILLVAVVALPGRNGGKG
jgi:uncharacterized repeat protein (TIGR01451 family)